MPEEWLNAPGPYIQYCYSDLAAPKIRQLLDKYPFFFDEHYWYWYAKGRKDIIKRAPLWTYPHKTIPAEKAARRKAQSQKAQTKLK